MKISEIICEKVIPPKKKLKKVAEKESAPTIKTATKSNGSINLKRSNAITDPHDYFGNN